jgi:DNA-binding NarL/FixJ family response regulator
MTKRILVVDDHDVVRQGIRLILRKHSEWQVVAEAENGSEAIEKARSLDPDLMILDISMPGKDGLEVIADLVRLNARSKVLVLTMHDSQELSQAVEKSGASGYLVKTHAARDLVRAMQKIFDGGKFFPSDVVPPPKPAKGKKTPEGGMFRFALGLSGIA